jgi:hypothetical protein
MATTTQLSNFKLSRFQQPENCENRNDPDLVQAFLKKWWVESDFKAPNLESLKFESWVVVAIVVW